MGTRSAECLLVVGQVASMLKGSRPLMKKPSLDPMILDNYQTVSSISLKWVVTSQRLGEADYLDPLQPGFGLGEEMETTLVTLVDDICQELDSGSVSQLLIPLTELFFWAIF